VLKVRAQPLLAVKDVKASARWYADLLGLDYLSRSMPSDHDDVYDRILDGERLVLQLHSWDDEDHPNLVGADRTRPGHGVLVWFEVDDFRAAVARAKKLGVEVVREIHVNPGPRHHELWLRDPDGYTVVVCDVDGAAR
jgi:catechol 2,3-dioxygenase-like lactoylglutathione lyase family enzyme